MFRTCTNTAAEQTVLCDATTINIWQLFNVKNDFYVMYDIFFIINFDNSNIQVVLSLVVQQNVIIQ